MLVLVVGNGNGVDPDEDLAINKETAIKSEQRQVKISQTTARIARYHSSTRQKASSSDSSQPQHQFKKRRQEKNYSLANCQLTGFEVLSEVKPCRNDKGTARPLERAISPGTHR